MESPAPTARDRILAAIANLNEDELEVVAVVCERVAGQGRKTYGPLRLQDDGRDFASEALSEVADAAVYAACAIVRERRTLHDEFAAAREALEAVRDECRTTRRMAGTKRAGDSKAPDEFIEVPRRRVGADRGRPKGGDHAD